MSSSHQSMTMSMQQAKINCHKVVTKYFTYFPVLQIVSGKGSRFWLNVIRLVASWRGGMFKLTGGGGGGQEPHLLL